MDYISRCSQCLGFVLAFGLWIACVGPFQAQQGEKKQMPSVLGATDAHGRLPESTIPLSYHDGDRAWTATLVATPAWTYSAQRRTLSIDMGNAATNDYLVLRDVYRSPGCQRAFSGCGPSVGGIQVYRIGEARATHGDHSRAS